MFYRPLTPLFAALIALLFIANPVQSADSQPVTSASQIAILKSNATRAEKAAACRALAVIGGKDAVPALVELLSNEELNHMARYALETIPDRSVDEALREALGRLKGRPLIGVIGSIGVRRDALAVVRLTQKLNDPDTEIAQAAARALGRIGNKGAASSLRDALERAPETTKLSIYEGLFRCAESLASQNQSKDALEVYDDLRSVPAPHQVRAGALIGSINLRGPEGVSLLQQSLRHNDYVLFAAAVRASIGLKGAETTQALTTEMPNLPPDRQIVALEALGQRSDPAALPVILSLAKSGPLPVRVAALKALPGLNQAASIPPLVEWISDKERDIAATAQESLAAQQLPEVDAAILKLLNDQDTPKRLLAMDLMSRRRMTANVDSLLKSAQDSTPEVRLAALKRLGDLSPATILPDLLGLLMNAKLPAELDAASQTVSQVCNKAQHPEDCINQVVSKLATAAPAQKSAILSVLGATGGPRALDAVRASVKDPSAEVRTAAIRALGDWKTADAAPDLLALAQALENPTERTLCLRAYLGLAGNADFPSSQRLEMCRKSASLVQRNEEKQMLLAALGAINSPDAITIILPFLNDPATKNAAAAAATGIAEKILKSPEASKQFAGQLIQPLSKVIEADAGDDITRRAKAAAQQAMSKAQ
ncbi:MAG TPA: HEAT repeat domain-containing protein [Candidatus Paceibacterota bacterium]|nr:HEAT repeat domain-containing protein [Verrucomicrobiota bacterium]HRY48347.1 HEAT repeat domain-containing protein [Candidatus Paceibacterota bacterium]